MKITKNSVVSIDYILKNDEGNILDSSEGRGPLSYLHGANNIIPGLENALEGQSVGSKLKVVVEPSDGYGEFNESLVQDVPREHFPEDMEIKPGMRFHAQTEHGPVMVEVKNVEEKNITVDGNHPMAGVRLNFDVTVLGIRDANPEELAHGHPHMEGGCCGGHGHGHDHEGGCCCGGHD